jgi:A/G-specific adenine glycosylase
MSFEKGCQHELPVKAGKTKVSDLWLYYFVVLRGEEILIRHRMHSGIWKGLYDFPSIEKPESTPIPEVLNQWKQERSLKGKLLLDGSPVELHHVLSHRRVHASFIALAAEEHIVCDESEQWISSKDILRFGVSRLVDRYIREHSQLLGGME